MKAALLALLLSAAAFAQEAPAPTNAPGKATEKSGAPPAAKPAEGTKEHWDAQLALLMESQEIPPEPTPQEVARKWKIHWEFHVVTLPAKLARPLLPELRDETTANAGWDKLKALIAKDQAEVVLATGGSLARQAPSDLFEGETVRYPIEFEGPTVLEPERNYDRTRILKLAPGEKISVAYGPTTFEMRKVGIALNVHATASADGQRLRVESAVDHTWLVAWDEFNVGRLANSETLVFRQPRFVSTQRKSITGMLSGERVLLSAHPLAPDPEKTELILLRVWTTLRKKEGGK